MSTAEHVPLNGNGATPPTRPMPERPPGLPGVCRDCGMSVRIVHSLDHTRANHIKTQWVAIEPPMVAYVFGPMATGGGIPRLAWPIHRCRDDVGTMLEEMILMLLGEVEETTATDMARTIGHSRKHTSTMLMNLVERGEVVATRSRYDPGHPWKFRLA